MPTHPNRDLEQMQRRADQQQKEEAADRRQARTAKTASTGATRGTTTTQRSKPTRVTPKGSPAKQTPPKKRKEHNPEIAFWTSIPIFFAGVLLLIASISYLYNWQVDQSISSWDQLFSDQPARNWGGHIGATVSSKIVGTYFGIFGLLVPVILIVLSIKVLRVEKLRLNRTLRSLIVVMILGSITMGHLGGVDVNYFGSGLGGQMGIYAAQWLENVIGSTGTTLFVVLSCVATIYFVNAHWVGRAYDGVAKYVARRGELRESRIANEVAKNNLATVLHNAKMLEQKEINAAKRAELELLYPNLAPTVVAPSTPAVVAPSTPAVVAPSTPAVVAPSTPAVVTPPAPEPIEMVTLQSDSYDRRNAVAAAYAADAAAAEAYSQKISKVAEPPFVDPDPNMIELDNGQFGYIYGVDSNGEIIYTYLDVAELPTISLRDSNEVDEPTSNYVASNQVDEPEQEEEIGFTIRTRHVSDEAPIDMETYNQFAASQAVAAAKAAAVVASASGSMVPRSEVANDEGPATKIVHFSPSPNDPNFIVETIVTEQVLDDRLINLTEVYDPTLELRNYQKPPVELLTDHSLKVMVTNEELVENKNRIVETLANFGIEIRSIEATSGPTVTLYEIIPAAGVRISKIKNLEEDIALSLSALGIRIIAPIPGKGTIGIEVPNKLKEVVSMYSVIKSSRFQDSKYDLPIALGKNIQNETVVMDLAKMPHLLVAGATGQGKSVGLNAIITSLLYKKHPSELKFVLIDPKKVELTLYSKLEKHFLAKMPQEDKAIITDTQKVIYTLNSLCIEMSDRYDLLEAAKVRNFKEYNEKFINRRLNPEKGHRYLPYFVVIIDEFADLIMTAGREVETPIARLAQLARAVGIHLIIATQRPSVNIITGVIRANFPARIAFRVATATDSRTILDTGGANQLVGQGDMLVSNANEIIRVQCAFIDTPEVDLITEHISSQKGYPSAYELPEYEPETDGSPSSSSSSDIAKRDSLFDEVAHYVVTNQSGSASTIQRKFSIGFNRAGRIVDQLEAAGIVGKSDGSKARQVLVSDIATLEIIIG